MFIHQTVRRNRSEFKIESLQSSIKDVYAKDIEDWTDDNLSGKKLAEYEDIKKCADAFAKIVENNINTK